MAVKIQYASDLHLEFPANKNYVQTNPLRPEGDILVLGGDIVPFASLEKHRDFFDYVGDHFGTVYWLPGNHEYYNFDLADKKAELNEKIRSNVFLVNNTAVSLGGMKLLFSTLWSRISPGNQWYVEKNLNDFRLIKNKEFRLSAETYNQLHADSLAFIQRELAETGSEKLAVFTHHCPTFLNYPEQYRGDVLNEAFAVELYDWIESSKIDYWVYGHHHSNIPDFAIGTTKLLTNQLGYVQRNEHFLFNPGKFFELVSS